MKSLKDLKKQIEELPIFSHPLYIRYSHFIVSGAVLVVGLLIAGLVTVPQFFKLLDTFKTIGELNQKKNFFQQKVATLSGIDEELYRKNLETALIALPVDKEIPSVTGAMLVALSGSGMTLEGIGIAAGSTAEANQTGEYSLNLEVSGTRENLQSFLERVKLLPRIIKLTALDISRGRSENLSVSVSFVTLYQTLPEHIGTVEEEVPQLSAEDVQLLTDIETKVRALPEVGAASGAVPVEGKTNPFAP